MMKVISLTNKLNRQRQVLKGFLAKAPAEDLTAAQVMRKERGVFTNG